MCWKQVLYPRLESLVTKPVFLTTLQLFKCSTCAFAPDAPSDLLSGASEILPLCSHAVKWFF